MDKHKWTYNTISQRDITYPINVWNSHKGTALNDSMDRSTISRSTDKDKIRPIHKNVYEYSLLAFPLTGYYPNKVYLIGLLNSER